MTTMFEDQLYFPDSTIQMKAKHKQALSDLEGYQRWSPIRRQGIFRELLYHRLHRPGEEFHWEEKELFEMKEIELVTKVSLDDLVAKHL